MSDNSKKEHPREEFEEHLKFFLPKPKDSFLREIDLNEAIESERAFIAAPNKTSIKIAGVRELKRVRSKGSRVRDFVKNHFYDLHINERIYVRAKFIGMVMIGSDMHIKFYIANDVTLYFCPYDTGVCSRLNIIEK